MNSVRHLIGIAAALVITAVAGPAHAACPSDQAVAALAERFLAGEPAEALDVASIADGLCAQAKLVTLLSQHWGEPVGHKAGLTSAAAQGAFGVDEPVRGVLLADMLLPDGATLPADFGALPRYEADLIVVVGDAAINDATTPDEVLASLDAVHPFIELPDLVLGDPTALSGPVITSINVGARHGVLGDPIPAEPTQAFLQALSAMTVTVTTADGAVLATAPGSSVLGHPLNAMLWLRNNGVVFDVGDLVSVGSIGPLLVPEPGLTATVTYTGLPGNPRVSVSFE